MSALFPNVPNVPGVPSVRRLASSLVNQVVARLTSDQLIGVEQEATQWGTFKEDGGLAIEPTSVAAFEFAKEYRISDYPIEGGKFESYDKVETPFIVRLEMTKGGTDFDRAQFLADLDALCDTTDTFDVITPDGFYPKSNFVRYDTRRTSQNGVTLLTVNAILQQVRVGASAQFTSSKSASGADPVSNGPVQTVPASEAQPSAV